MFVQTSRISYHSPLNRVVMFAGCDTRFLVPVDYLIWCWMRCSGCWDLFNDWRGCVADTLVVIKFEGKMLTTMNIYIVGKPSIVPCESIQYVNLHFIIPIVTKTLWKTLSLSCHWLSNFRIVLSRSKMVNKLIVPYCASPRRKESRLTASLLSKFYIDNILHRDGY